MRSTCSSRHCSRRRQQQNGEGGQPAASAALSVVIPICATWASRATISPCLSCVQHSQKITFTDGPWTLPTKNHNAHRGKPHPPAPSAPRRCTPQFYDSLVSLPSSLPLPALPPRLNTPRLAEQARDAERARREAAAKAAEYEKAAREELDRLRARRAAAKKVTGLSAGVTTCMGDKPYLTAVRLFDRARLILPAVPVCPTA